MPHRVYDQSDATSVLTQLGRLPGYVTEKWSLVADHLDAARDDLRAITTFPKDVWTPIRSNNLAW